MVLQLGGWAGANNYSPRKKNILLRNVTHDFGMGQTSQNTDNLSFMDKFGVRKIKADRLRR
jgi:hypothetical protein